MKLTRICSLSFFIVTLSYGGYCQVPDQNAESSKPKIAIIGGGVGGGATAYFLRQHFGPDLDMTVYERGRIGGRLATVKIAGKTYEVGGSVIHPANQLMLGLVETLGLRKRSPEPPSAFSIITSEGNIFQVSSWSLIAKFQLAWRYGIFTLLKLGNYIETMLENFEQIYPHLESKQFFKDVPEMLAIMSPKSKKKNLENNNSMLDETKVSLKEQLQQQGFSDIFIDELVAAAVRCNYGQMPKTIHAFVGSVALAGAEDGLWSIEGGNWKLVEKLIQTSNATVIDAKVLGVTLVENGQFSLEYERSSNDPHPQRENRTYDVVVIASPQTDDNNPLEINGLGNKLSFPGNFHRTVATLVHGEVNPAFLGFEDTTVNFIVDPTTNVNSLTLEYPVDYKSGDQVPNVWKVFSQNPLSQIELKKLFSEVKESHVVDWLAYPHYNVPESQAVSSFVLHNNLYYLSAVEWAASAMEMSVISAKNAANLISHKWLPDQNANVQETVASNQEL